MTPPETKIEGERQHTVSSFTSMAGGDIVSRARDDCVMAVARAQKPQLWTWSNLTGVEDLRTLTGRGANPLKNWLLSFYGGKQNGGVDVSFKIRGFWAPKRAGLLAKWSKDWVPLLTSGLNCSHWVENPTFRLDWARDDRRSKRFRSKDPPHYHTSARRLLNEVIVYHVDRMLGLQTVPTGKLVEVSTTLWAKSFSDFFCVERKAHKALLTRRVDSKTDSKDVSNRMVIIGWMQKVISPLVDNAPPLRELGCGKFEPNGTDVGGGPLFLKSYYEALLVGAIAFRGDLNFNCFATLADTDTVEGCKRGPTQHLDNLQLDVDSWSLRHDKDKKKWNNNLRVVNLDNDKTWTTRPSANVVWHRPCSVPQYLRARVLRINNFSATLLEQIRLNEPLLSKSDMAVIQKQYLSIAEPYFMRLADQFRKCETRKLNK